MNLINGTIEEIYVKEGTTMARVSVRGAQMHVPLYFLSDAVAGDEVLIDSGVAISRVQTQDVEEP